MTTIEVKAKKKIYTVSEEEYQEHCDAYDGLCLSCGEWTCGGVEPDAEKYECDECEEPRVYGAEQALMLGRLHISGNEASNG